MYVTQRLSFWIIEVIRCERMKEAGNLPIVSERARMYARAQTWVPPTPSGFGGLADFLS